MDTLTTVRETDDVDPDNDDDYTAPDYDPAGDDDSALNQGISDH